MWRFQVEGAGDVTVSIEGAGDVAVSSGRFNNNIR